MGIDHISFTPSPVMDVWVVSDVASLTHPVCLPGMLCRPNKTQMRRPFQTLKHRARTRQQFLSSWWKQMRASWLTVGCLFPTKHSRSCSSSWKFSAGIRAVCVLIAASASSTCHSVIIVSILTFIFSCKTNDSKWLFKGMVFMPSDSKVWHLTFMENRYIFCH